MLIHCFEPHPGSPEVSRPLGYFLVTFSYKRKSNRNPSLREIFPKRKFPQKLLFDVVAHATLILDILRFRGVILDLFA